MEHGLLSVTILQAVQSFMSVIFNSPHALFYICPKNLINKGLSGGDVGATV